MPNLLISISILLDPLSTVVYLAVDGVLLDSLCLVRHSTFADIPAEPSSDVPLLYELGVCGEYENMSVSMNNTVGIGSARSKHVSRLCEPHGVRRNAYGDTIR